jgi:mercuric ion transport protein
MVMTSNRDRIGAGSLAFGALTAVLASTCCLGPLVLVTLGLGGAWVANLTALEPYRPWFLAASLAALALAWHRLYRRPAQVDCQPGEVCAVPAVRRLEKILFWVVAALVALGFGFPFVAPFFY